MPTPEQNRSEFATYQSLSRMVLLFKAQAKLLEDLLATQLSEINQPLLPLLGAISENCKTLLLLEKAGLMNELMLIERIFVQRIINCCYLLAAGKDEITHYVSHPIVQSGSTLKDGSGAAFVEFAKEYKPEVSASAFKLTLSEQAEVASKMSGIPKDMFLVAVASVFPKSSELMSGSLYGTLFHFDVFRSMQERDKTKFSHPSESHSNLFYTMFLSVGLLHALFKTVAKCEPIEIDKESDANHDAAGKLAMGLLGKEELSLFPIDGVWERLDKIEFGTNELFGSRLVEVGLVVRDAYDVGYLVPRLKPTRPVTLDLNSAALFLKRVLNDLRVVWLLLTSGYTSQAASVAASLWESALACICLTLNQGNIDEYTSIRSGKIPWNKRKMAEMVTRANKKLTIDEEREKLGEATYKHYSWLCDIKHASRGSLIHDAQASEIPGKGYVVMAIPNHKDEDMKHKMSVAVLSLIYTLDCVRAFAIALGYDEDKFPDDFGFAQIYQRALEANSRLIEKM